MFPADSTWYSHTILCKQTNVNLYCKQNGLGPGSLSASKKYDRIWSRCSRRDPGHVNLGSIRGKQNITFKTYVCFMFLKNKFAFVHTSLQRVFEGPSIYLHGYATVAVMENMSTIMNCHGVLPLDATTFSHWPSISCTGHNLFSPICTSYIPVAARKSPDMITILDSLKVSTY